MAESRLQFDPSADLERALREIAPLVSFPPTPDLADTIRARIAAEQASSRPARSWSALLRPRRLAVAFLVLLLVVAAALTLSPGLRTSVANRLGVHGIEIIFVEETPTPAAPSWTSPTTPQPAARIRSADPQPMFRSGRKTPWSTASSSTPPCATRSRSPNPSIRSLNPQPEYGCRSVIWLDG
jgi:hypothetical protein